MPSCFEVGRRSYEEELEEDQWCLEPREQKGKECKTRGRVGREQAVQDEVGRMGDGSFSSS